MKLPIRKQLLWLTAALLCTTSQAGVSVAAESRREAFLVSTQWLADHMQDSGLVIIQVGSKGDYDAGHIPGAQFLSLDNISTPHRQGLMLELPPISQLVAAFQKLGVSDQSRIILCYAGERVTPVGRTFMTLDYLGLGDKTTVLDGGLNAWRQEKRTMTKEVRAAAPGSLTTHLRTEHVVDAAWVKAHLNEPHTKILGARTPQYYSGSDSGGMPRAGHVPGAANIPFSSLVDDSNHFKSAAALEEMFRAAGVKPGDQVVTYCHIGLQASLLYFVARSLGYDAHLYDGSWEDWSARKDFPIETGGQK